MNFLYKKHRSAPPMKAAGAVKHRGFTGSKVVMRLMLTMFAFGGAISLGAVRIATANAAAANALEYTVDPTNAAGGVYARFGPHANDTNRVNGYGVYPNETVELLCGVTDGDLVGQYANTTWHFVTDLSNPGEGNFWVSDHYLDTPNAASQLTPGESLCPNESSDPLATTPPAQSDSPVMTVFFSPNTTPTGLSDLIYDPTFNNDSLAAIPSDEWMSADYCSDADVGQFVPTTASTLAGWSESRLAPIYFLAANPDRWSQIHTIVLFDPGDTNDFTGNSCDTGNGYDINALLADWLLSDTQGNNKLFVFTGERSETDGFHGLWTYYFAGIWNQPFANQATVCDYNGMGHPDVLQNFAGYLGGLNSMTTCPPSPDDAQYPLTQWNP